MSPEANPGRRSPLWAVLAIAFLASLGTGVIVNGIYFLTRFDKIGSYGLGVAMGASYIAAALGASPALAMIRRCVPAATARSVIGAILIGVAMLCALPSVAGVQSWAAWVIVVGYGVLTGLLWPLIEGYVSGGRRGAALRRATGQFNIWWAGALVVAFIAMAPLAERNPEAILLGLGVAHLAALGFVMKLAPEPGVTMHDEHEPHPPVYSRLLRVFRVQLPTSYMVMGALSPYLPIALDELGVDESRQTPIAAVWLLTRVVTFVIMERWHGWHGRWWVSIAGGVLLLAGFAACLLAPLGPGLGVLVAGLAVFGVGMGMIYTAALYYAMEIGAEEVASGGAHEALIGGGYLTGPLTGLGAAVLVSAGAISPAAFEPTKLAVVAVLCVLLAGAAAVLARPGRNAA